MILAEPRILMVVSTSALCVSLCITLGATARAIEYPVTAATAHQAVAYGQARSTTDVLLDTRYETQADRETWVNYRPTCRIETPYLELAYQAAKAHQKYSRVSPSTISKARASHELDVSADLFSPELGMNHDVVGILKQGGRTIRATHVDYLDEDVVEDPQVGYRRTATLEFDLRRLNPKRPFTVTFANVLVNGRDGEFTCSIDPTAFP